MDQSRNSKTTRQQPTAKARPRMFIDDDNLFFARFRKPNLK
jgi:hypothetical protein